MITVSSLSELLPGTGSVSSAVTLAVFVSTVPGATSESTVAAMTSAPGVPTATAGRVQVTVAPAAEHSAEDAAPLKVVSGGKVSVTTTVVASLGPLFVTVRSHTMSVPAATSFSRSTFSIVRSASRLTSVLFGALTGSSGLAGQSTVAVFSSELPSNSAESVSTVIVTVAVAPFSNVPKLHCTTPLSPTGGPEQEPRSLVALTNVVPLGIASLSTASTASDGPRFSATMV